VRCAAGALRACCTSATGDFTTFTAALPSLPPKADSLSPTVNGTGPVVSTMIVAFWSFAAS
jgi:hypothetical protein